MNIPRSVSLIEALSVSIERIKKGFDIDFVKICKTKKGKNVTSIQEESFVRIFQPEYHSFTEVCICITGSFAIQMDNSIVNLKEGDTCILLPGYLHNELPKQNEEYTALWIAINFNRAVLHLSGSNRETPFYTIDGYSLKPDYDSCRIVESLRQEVENDNCYSEELIKANVLNLLVTAFREMQDLYNGKWDGDSWRTSIIAEVQKYIRSNYSRNIKLNDVSQIVCVSPNYLNTMFKVATGMTIMQFHEECRIDMAKSLLKDTGFTISDISLKLGYYDQFHFSKMFKKVVGMSPLKYRTSSI